MSPEQAEGKVVDARSDIFSFGSLLYEMVGGRRAFQGETKISTLSAILRDDPKPLSHTGADAPRDLEKLIARCMRKDPARRFQHMDDIKIALEELKEESDSGQLSETMPPARQSRSTLLYAGLAAVVVLGCALLFWQLRKSPAAQPGLNLRPLTQDPGLSFGPTISPDGKLVAYASDRAGEGNMDIWVQQLSRGAQPIRLTRHKADDVGPSFSPDGGQIVYLSTRDGGGIYVIPALGGEERLLLRGNYNRMRFSPDGQWIVAMTWGSAANRMMLVPATGGAARRIAEDFYMPGSPAWSPDGKRILFWGQREEAAEADWWVLPIEGGSATATGAARVLKPPAGQTLPRVSEWLDDYVLYSTGNLYRIAISPRTFQVSGEPERLTTSSANESNPRAVNIGRGKPGEWRIVFATTQSSSALWSMPIDANTGKALGEPEKMFRDGVERLLPTLSADASRLLYVFREVDSFGARLRDLKTSVETTLVRSPVFFRARLSPDGSTVAYNPTDNVNETVIHLVSSAGGDSRKLCDNCGLIYHWTRDGKRILYRTGNPMRFNSVEVATGQQTPVLAHPKHFILVVRYSPDGGWLAMQYGRGREAPPALFIAPVRNGKAAPESEWIPIMDRPGVHQRPWWSPDGNRLYFLSNANGQEDIWSQRLDPATKRPVGEPQILYHPQIDRLAIQAGVAFGPGESPNRLIFPIEEATGNIWIAE
jgi:Tol biopolymer transport system component